MIDEAYKKEFNKYDSVYNSEMPGKSPADISFEKTNEIYAMLATPLKNMRAKAMRETAANCFKDKWMDDAVPNPHQVEICQKRVLNKHMGYFYENLTNMRESTRYRYQDCIVDANNNVEKAVYCVRDYLSGIDADNLALKAKVEQNCAKYF